jgi:glycerophosphoryl diester phosphodiesterase
MTSTAIWEAFYDIRPLIFGHRGAPFSAPANTLPAFELAAQQGAHGIELDVQLSCDGHLAVIHDFAVDATTDGTGLVKDSSLAALQTLDAGGWFAPEFAGTRIPTLDDVFEAVGQRVFINVEIKLFRIFTNGIEQAVAECIARHNMQHRVLVSSFNPLTLRRFRRVLPEVPIGYLHARKTPAIVHLLTKGIDYEAYHPQDEFVNAALVARAHSAGQIVNAWTVNDVARGRALRDLGVDGIITDVPDQMVAALHQPADGG